MSTLISILSLCRYIQSPQQNHHMYIKYSFPSIPPPHLAITPNVVVRLQMLKRASCACTQHATSYFCPYTHQRNITPFSHSESLVSTESLQLHYSCKWRITDTQGSGRSGERMPRGCGGETGCFRREPSRHLSLHHQDPASLCGTTCAC